MTVILEDQFHAEWHGEFNSWSEALAVLQRLAETPWDQRPNRCPCSNWQTCHREYELIEYDTSSTPWTEIKRLGGLEVSAKGVEWYADFENGTLPSGSA